MSKLIESVRISFLKPEGELNICYFRFSGKTPVQSDLFIMTVKESTMMLFIFRECGGNAIRCTTDFSNEVINIFPY